MPTQLPRVNVTVTEEQHALLLELASLDRGRSAAGMLREMLDQATPLLRATVATMRAAAQEHQNARGELAEMMAQMQSLVDKQTTLPLPPAQPVARNRSDAGARTARRAARKGRKA